jgi:hypothetical protein
MAQGSAHGQLNGLWHTNHPCSLFPQWFVAHEPSLFLIPQWFVAYEPSLFLTPQWFVAYEPSLFLVVDGFLLGFTLPETQGIVSLRIGCGFMVFCSDLRWPRHKVLCLYA